MVELFQRALSDGVSVGFAALGLCIGASPFWVPFGALLFRLIEQRWPWQKKPKKDDVPF